MRYEKKSKKFVIIILNWNIMESGSNVPIFNFFGSPNAPRAFG